MAAAKAAAELHLGEGFIIGGWSPVQFTFLLTHMHTLEALLIAIIFNEIQCEVLNLKNFAVKGDPVNVCDAYNRETCEGFLPS